MSGLYLKTLVRAVTVAGGEQNLALRLEVTPSELSSWLRAMATPPHEIFLKASRLINEAELAQWRRPMT
jgi:DNA-binding transcriptional regulator YdaS (Cro superfamily)